MEAKKPGCGVEEQDAGTLWPLLPREGVGPFPVQLRF
jgi:hypothetical protein